MQDDSVLIIGAGMAGAIAARQLVDANRPVVVVDKSRGAGGRCTTRRKDELAFDHGAQYFTARGQELNAAVRRWKEAGVVDRWKGRLVQCHDGSLKPLSDEDRWVGVPGMSSIARHLLTGVDVRYEHTVSQITCEDGRWQATTNEGHMLRGFSHLLITVPAPQCAVLLEPVAPTLAAHAARASLSPCWALMLAFGQRLDLPFDGAQLAGDEPLDWVARDSSKPGRPASPPECWVAHASAKWSEDHLEMDRDDAGSALLEAFENMCSRHEVNCPQPMLIRSHRWRYSKVSQAVEQAVMKDADKHLYVAGDWLLSGKVEAAFNSGTAAAGEILSTA